MYLKDGQRSANKLNKLKFLLTNQLLLYLVLNFHYRVKQSIRRQFSFICQVKFIFIFSSQNLYEINCSDNDEDLAIFNAMPFQGVDVDYSQIFFIISYFLGNIVDWFPVTFSTSWNSEISYF